MPFKVKRTTLFDKIFKAYCQKKALDQATLVFMDAEGHRLNPNQSPAEVRAPKLQTLVAHRIARQIADLWLDLVIPVYAKIAYEEQHRHACFCFVW